MGKLIALLFFLSPSVALADYFQIFDGSRRTYIPYAQVSIQRKVVGYTDMYGRIEINLTRGAYNGEIVYRREQRRVRFVIDGSRTLKRVEAF